MSVPYEMHLHPELLSNEQLIAVIQERHLRIPNMDKMEREDLLELFHSFCVPYGQRKYRDSGRGKLLNTSRNIPPEVLPQSDIISNCPNRKPAHPTKIKHPPDLLSGHMKRIKCDHHVPANKRKLEIDSVTTLADATPNKKERKPITWP